MTDFMGDTAWLVGQPEPTASVDGAMIDLSSCMLPAWPWAPTRRRKASRPLHPTAPQATAAGSREPRVLAGDDLLRANRAAPRGAAFTLCQGRPTPLAVTRAMGIARQALTGSTAPT